MLPDSPQEHGSTMFVTRHFFDHGYVQQALSSCGLIAPSVEGRSSFCILISLQAQAGRATSDRGGAARWQPVRSRGAFSKSQWMEGRFAIPNGEATRARRALLPGAGYSNDGAAAYDTQRSLGSRDYRVNSCVNK
jgi:hypothetical protein